MLNLPLSIGQIHAIHELFKANPRAAAFVLILIVVIALYFRYRR